jgi:ElaB/YqjD/DUF883 family membrane-anchored ribosome-binding protein
MSSMLSSSLSDRIANDADKAVNMVQSSANGLIHGTRDGLAEAVHHLGDSLHQLSQNTQGRVRKDPLKSMLLAAGVGMLLVGVVGYLTRSSRHHD